MQISEPQYPTRVPRIFGGLPVRGILGRQQLGLMLILVSSPGAWHTVHVGFRLVELRPLGHLISAARDGVQAVGGGWRGAGTGGQGGTRSGHLTGWLGWCALLCWLSITWDWSCKASTCSGSFRPRVSAEKQASAVSSSPSLPCAPHPHSGPWWGGRGEPGPVPLSSCLPGEKPGSMWGGGGRVRGRRKSLEFPFFNPNYISLGLGQRPGHLV